MGCAVLFGVVILITLLMGLARSDWSLDSGNESDENAHCEVEETGPYEQEIICEPE